MYKPNNDPNKPTCQAVQRLNERGVRIHPRGCQVRYRVAKQWGTGEEYLVKYEKRTGKLKAAQTSFTETWRAHTIQMQVGPLGYKTDMTYDTGAAGLTTIDMTTAIQAGLLNAGFSHAAAVNALQAMSMAPLTNDAIQSGVQFDRIANTSGIDGSVPNIVLKNVPVKIGMKSMRVRLFVGRPNAPQLLGTNIIKELGSSYKLKFKNIVDM